MGLAAPGRRLGRGIGAPGRHPINRTFVGAYVAALFTALGAVMLMAQIGVGDPRQGASYTLSSITAVVLGGTSLRGGRGTFIGTALGAILLMEVLNADRFPRVLPDLRIRLPGGADHRRRSRLRPGALAATSRRDAWGHMIRST